MSRNDQVAIGCFSWMILWASRQIGGASGVARFRTRPDSEPCDPWRAPVTPSWTSTVLDQSMSVVVALVQLRFAACAPKSSTTKRLASRDNSHADEFATSRAVFGARRRCSLQLCAGRVGVRDNRFCFARGGLRLGPVLRRRTRSVHRCGLRCAGVGDVSDVRRVGCATGDDGVRR